MAMRTSLTRRVHPDALPGPARPASPDGRLEQLVAANMADAAAVIRTGDGVILYTNSSFDRLFGYGPEELAGRHVSVINAPVDVGPEERAHDIMRALEDHGAWVGEVHNVRRDGTLLWTVVEVVEVEQPEFGKVWVAVQREVPDRTAVRDAMRDSEERYRAAFECSPSATLLLDDAARIIDANDAFCHLTGFGRDEMLDKPLADLTHPADSALDGPFLASVFRGEPRTEQRRYMTRDGDILTAKLEACVVRAADGHALYAVAAVTP